MKRIFILLTGILMLITCVLKAQTNFEPGYVLITEKDTVFGAIDNRSYDDNGLYCSFKASGKDSIVRYTPDKIYGYRFTNGKYYIAKTIEFDKEQRALFLEYLIHGKLDVYYFQDKTKLGHYYASMDSLTIRELKYGQEIVNDNGQLFQKESKDYVGVLTYLTRDCKQISSDIANINKPDHKKMIHFAEKYHNLTCTDQQCIIYEKKMPKKIQLRVSGGLNKFYFQDTTIHKWYPTYGFDCLFQQLQQSENIYLGIGLYRMSKMEGMFLEQFTIPVSINYINSRQGFSPTFSYEFNFNMWLMTQGVSAGLNYNFTRSSIFLTGKMYTEYFVEPFAFGLNMGMTFLLR